MAYMLTPVIRHLGTNISYDETWQAMRRFTEQRTAETPDELWVLEHAPVYTLGQAGMESHVLNAAGIPLVRSDRGGQVTYHGPGQVVVYCLIDLRRIGLYVKAYVAMLEQAIIDVLTSVGLDQACRKVGAPGVYVPGSCVSPVVAPPDELVKVAALGVKIRNGCSYHGLALNVNMDLNPFLGINPCGYQGLQTSDLQHCGLQLSTVTVGELLVSTLQQALSDAAKQHEYCSA